MGIYEGSERYIFVSYAHKDSATVVPIIDALQTAGFRVWYDQGIEAGTEWPAYIEDHLNRCSRVIVFMTNATVDSVNCRNEINLASMLNKEILVVYLEQTMLSHGLSLQLNSKQSLFKYRHPSNESFLGELLRARILQCCKEGAEPEEDEPFTPASTGVYVHGAFPPAASTAESRDRDATILAHMGGDYAIARVGSVGTQTPREPHPQGNFSQRIPVEQFAAMQFHCTLLKPSEQTNANIRIYDHRGALVYERLGMFVTEGTSSFAIGWAFRDESGICAEKGNYTALIWTDNSRAFEYSFSLVSDGSARKKAIAEAEKLSRNLKLPSLFLFHLLAWIAYSIFFVSIERENAGLLLIGGVLSLVITIICCKKARKFVVGSRFLAFLLTFVLSPYYGVYLAVMTVIALIKRKEWKSRIAILYSCADE